MLHALRFRGSGDRYVLLLVFCSGIAIRVAWQILTGFYDRPALRGEYDGIAQNILAGHGYVYEFLGTQWLTFGLPLWPLILTVLHALSGGPDRYAAIGVFEAISSASLSLFAFGIALRLRDRASGLVAAAIVAAYPPLIQYAASVHELNVEAPLAAALLIVAIDETRRPTRGVRLGVIAGAAAFMRPTLAVFAAVAAAARAWKVPRWGAAVAVAIMVAISLPWSVRNAVALGSFSPSSPYNCVTLWLGNNPDAFAGGGAHPGGRFAADVLSDDLRARVIGRPEAEQGRILCEAAWSFIWADPVREMGWWARKLFYFWWFPPEVGLFYPGLRGLLDLYRLAYALELAVAAVGAVAVWRTGSRAALLLLGLQAATVSLVQSSAYVDGHHRLVLEGSLAALAAVGVLAVVERIPHVDRVVLRARS